MLLSTQDRQIEIHWRRHPLMRPKIKSYCCTKIHWRRHSRVTELSSCKLKVGCCSRVKTVNDSRRTVTSHFTWSKIQIEAQLTVNTWIERYQLTERLFSKIGTVSICLKFAERVENSVESIDCSRPGSRNWNFTRIFTFSLGTEFCLIATKISLKCAEIARECTEISLVTKFYCVCTELCLFTGSACATVLQPVSKPH